MFSVWLKLAEYLKHPLADFYCIWSDQSICIITHLNFQRNKFRDYCATQTCLTISGGKTAANDEAANKESKQFVFVFATNLNLLEPWLSWWRNRAQNAPICNWNKPSLHIKQPPFLNNWSPFQNGPHHHWGKQRVQKKHHAESWKHLSSVC